MFSRFIGVLMIFPIKVRTLKFDRTHVYIFGLALWALTWTLYYHDGDLPRLRSDDCALTAVKDLPIYAKVLLNLGIIMIAMFVCEWMVSRSLKLREKRAKGSWILPF